MLDDIISQVNSEGNYNELAKERVSRVLDEELRDLDLLISRNQYNVGLDCSAENENTQILHSGHNVQHQISNTEVGQSWKEDDSVLSTVPGSRLIIRRGGIGWRNSDKHREEHDKNTRVVGPTGLTKTVSCAMGLLWKSFLRIYFLLRQKKLTSKHRDLIQREGEIFYGVLGLFFPINRPCYHDGIHMLFDQLSETIDPSICNTSKTEAMNKEHRAAAKAGNNQACEFFILFNQYTSRLLQYMLDGSYFYLKEQPSSPFAPIKAIPTGPKTKELIRDFLVDKNSRIQPSSSNMDDPYVPHDWWHRKAVPPVCKDSIRVRFLHRSSSSKRPLEFQITSDMLTVHHSCHCSKPLLNVQKCFKATVAEIPGIGEITENECVIQISPTDIAVTSSNGLLLYIFVHDVLCIPQQTEKVQPTRTPEIDSLEEKKTEIEHRIAMIQEKIARKQRELTGLAAERKNLDQQLTSLKKREQHKWMPSVILRGNLIQKVPPTYPYQAALQIVELPETVLLCAKHLQNIYKTEKMSNGALSLQKFI